MHRRIGLTGGIASGKSSVAEMLERLGAVVIDADVLAREVVQPGTEGFSAVVERFGEAVVAGDGGLDRPRLGQIVFGDPRARADLEAIIHPLVRDDEERFLKKAAQSGVALAVLDIPLLLETGGAVRCDAVLVATAPLEVQRQRVLARPGMTPDKFAAILGKQMPDAEKRAQAHFLVDTSRGFASAEAQLRSILASLAGRPGAVLADS